ncbi:MAG: hypothetical protein IPG17_02630 [Sandaracinaceae bacterium]|nr:hypothetical protein [Sandaracinaceae bacterium]MBK7151580.1 hypothetical protein [Sandaracinaceae bacterium]MBK8409449.1 hypothetical protein [Sandaracinaceae bacterium]MBK8592010.1 hypothetical protein [Sandaracinaceae bacterium]MBP7681993.1 hypothetical protein [Deltaproteobacteria bacterium]
MKPAASTATPPRPDTTRHATHVQKRPPAAEHGFAGHLATQRGLGATKHEELHGVGPPAGAKRGHDSELSAREDVGTRPPRSKRPTETDDAVAPPDGAPFRPLPSCVFAPSVGRVPTMTPSPVPPDVARMATELLRSMHVGGERGRGQVRLVLEGTRRGEPLQITLEETPAGLVATLPTADDEASRRLVRAIARELQRRGVELG